MKERVSFSEMWESRPFRAQLAAVLLLTVIFGATAYMLTDNEQPYEFDGATSEITPSVVKAGSQALVKWRFHKNRDCPGTLQRKLFDPMSNTLVAIYDKENLSEDILKAVKNDTVGTVPRSFRVPEGITHTGLTGYRSDLCYACNLLQRMGIRQICYPTPDLFFTISK